MRSTKTALRFDRFAPPGMPLKHMTDSFVGGNIIAALWAFFAFLISYSADLDDLYYTYLGVKHIYEGAVMPDFTDTLGGSLIIFNILALWMLGYAVYFYMSYYRGSKSIYTMRRLPDRWEIHKRSITLPLLAIAAILVVAFVMTMICFATYMIFTPDQCLQPHQ